MNLIPPNESRDKEKAKALFAGAGIAGVVAMRVVGKVARSFPDRTRAQP